MGNNNKYNDQKKINPKIGILTFHNTMNYGASLQAYALTNTVKALGFNSEVVNYICDTVDKRETPHKPLVRNILIHPLAFIRSLRDYPILKKRRAAFDSFIASVLQVGPQVCAQHELEKKYDGIIVGSDQVWNLKITGDDEFFFLNDGLSLDFHRIAYAASFGDGASFDDLSENSVEGLSKFSAISVREPLGLQILEKVPHVLDAKCVLDPTFLLTADEWRQIAICEKRDPYVLVYMVSETMRTLEFAQQYAASNNLDIIAIDLNRGRFKCGGVKTEQSVSPREFVGLIDNADTVVTSSFHGFCLALIFEKNVFYSEKRNNGEINDRVKGLADSLSISNHAIEDPVMGVAIDYEEVRIKLDQLKKDSLNYLSLSLRSGM